MMNVWIRKHRFAIVLIALALAALAWVLLAWPRGAVMAHVDHMRGHDEVKTFGTPAPWRDTYRTLLSDRYGVELNPVTGCFVNFESIKYVNGYNRVAMSYINEKHGTNIFEECAKEAQANVRETSDGLKGQIEWVRFPGTFESAEGPMTSVFGAAFLVLESDYESLGYEGPPQGHPQTTEAAVDWHRQMPEEWWSASSIPYEWWGRDSGTEPTEVTLPLDVPVPLLRAHLDSAGRFEFKDLPQGRHTLFIRWGKNPDPQNNLSGPYEVVVEQSGRIERVFPVNAFDLIDT